MQWLKKIKIHFLIRNTHLLLPFAKLQSCLTTLPYFLSERASKQVSSLLSADLHLIGCRIKTVHSSFYLTSNQSVLLKLAEGEGERDWRKRLRRDQRAKGMEAKHDLIVICIKREFEKCTFGMSLSCAGLNPQDVRISRLKWRGHPREPPVGLALPGFQRPSNLVAVACQEVDGNVWWRDNLYRTQPRAVRLFDRLINGKPPSKKPLSAEGSGEKKPSLIIRTPGIKAWPVLIN